MAPDGYIPNSVIRCYFKILDCYPGHTSKYPFKAFFIDKGCASNVLRGDDCFVKCIKYTYKRYISGSSTISM